MTKISVLSVAVAPTAGMDALAPSTEFEMLMFITVPQGGGLFVMATSMQDGLALTQGCNCNHKFT